jgi:S-methylmethionine-dependent homocysteine/selenocysteine methylase
LGERLRREYQLKPDENVALAGLIYHPTGKKALGELWGQYIEIAKNYGLPFMATTPTRRANKERVSKSGFGSEIIKDNVDFLKKLRDKFYPDNMYIGGLMGCKGDAYKATEVLTAQAAREFHFWQAELFREAGVDFLYAGIMPALTEAVGMAQAMEQTGIPYIISFMINRKGCLIDGTTIHNAIQIIDENVREKPVCYMTNCVHPKVLQEAISHGFNQTETVMRRFHGIQANTSPLSPE